jgi:hypothetical protein
MKVRNVMMSAALFATLSLSSVTVAAGAPPAPSPKPAPVASAPAAPAAAPTSEPYQRERNERHPEIRKAIEQLKRAQEDMRHAAHDFGGHREAALHACDEAINQLQLALQYDRK